MATNDTYALKVQGLVRTQQHIHTLHFRQVTPGLAAADLLDHYHAACATTFRAMFHNVDRPYMLLKAVPVCGTEPLDAGAEMSIVPPNDIGSRSGAFDQSPSFLAGLVAIKTALAGRSRQGRFFIGGLGDTDTDINAMTAGWIALAQAYVNALKAAYVTPGEGGAWRLVVHSRKLAAMPGTQCQNSSTPVTNLIVSTYATTVRSRKVGHGI